MREVILRFLAILALLGLLTPPGASRAEQPLDSYNVDLNQTSASGVSAGAYLAGQLHVAYSASMVGVALIAGGPYYCSQGSVWISWRQCWRDGTPGVDSLKVIETEAGQGTIDDPANLSDDRVYLFTGSNDSKVGNTVVDAAYRQYQQLVPESNILYVKDLYPAGHSTSASAPVSVTSGLESESSPQPAARRASAVSAAQKVASFVMVSSLGVEDSAGGEGMATNSTGAPLS